MIQELQDIFPRFTEQKIWKILLTIKARYKKHGVIGLSRLEAARFGTSERQMQTFINYLKQTKAIKKIRMACVHGFKCNVYSISKWFAEWLEDVKDFVRNVFEYINPTEYVKARYVIKREWWKLKFKVEWNRYIIHLRWKFKNVIYDVWNNCIINPIELWKKY